MNRRQRFGTGAAVAGVVIAVLAAVALPRMQSSAPPVSAPVFPPKVLPARDPPTHPVLPSEERVEVPKAFCEARDVFKVGGQLRATQKKALELAKAATKEGAAESCHADAAARALAGAYNALVGRTGACVARDSELDSQWSQLESAVAGLDRCIECTHPRADRLTGCTRVLELVDAAEKATTVK